VVNSRSDSNVGVGCMSDIPKCSACYCASFEYSGIV